MPQLIFKGVEQARVQAISKALVDELQQLVDCPRDYFTLEVPQTAHVFDGEYVAVSPLIQVNWFDRGQAVQDRVAQAITRHLQQAGCSQVDVFFVPLAAAQYYENGVHY